MIIEVHPGEVILLSEAGHDDHLLVPGDGGCVPASDLAVVIIKLQLSPAVIIIIITDLQYPAVIERGAELTEAAVDYQPLRARDHSVE